MVFREFKAENRFFQLMMKFRFIDLTEQCFNLVLNLGLDVNPLLCKHLQLIFVFVFIEEALRHLVVVQAVLALTRAVPTRVAASCQVLLQSV